MKASDSPTAWYGAMTAPERRTFWASFGGWTLNSIDFFLLIFAMPAIVVALDLTRHEAAHVASATLIASAIGGWIAGIAADRYGRVRVLQVTILWFAVFGLLCALVQDYWQLMAARILMALGLGGEWAVGAILIGEVIRPKDRGKAVGGMQSGWAVGWAIAAVVAIFIVPKVRPDIAWRILLALGVLPALFIFFIRSRIEEPKIFLETQKKLRRKKNRGWDFLNIFAPANLKATVMTTLLAAGTHGGYYTSAWLLDYLGSYRRITEMGTGRYIASIIGGAFIGYLVSAYLNDRIGRRFTFMLFAIGSAISVYVVLWLASNGHGVMFWGFMVCMFASGTFSGIGPTLTEHFPTHLRGSGQSFAYNGGRLLAAGVPTFLTFMSSRDSFNHIIDIVAISAYALVFIVAWFMHETNGKKLAPSN
jgi:MFS family permease